MTRWLALGAVAVVAGCASPPDALFRCNAQGQCPTALTCVPIDGVGYCVLVDGGVGATGGGGSSGGVAGGSAGGSAGGASGGDGGGSAGGTSGGSSGGGAGGSAGGAAGGSSGGAAGGASGGGAGGAAGGSSGGAAGGTAGGSSGGAGGGSSGGSAGGTAGGSSGGAGGGSSGGAAGGLAGGFAGGTAGGSSGGSGGGSSGGVAGGTAGGAAGGIPNIVASRSFSGTPFVSVTRFASASQAGDLTIATMRKSADGGSTWIEGWSPELTGRDAGSPTFSGFTILPEALASNAKGTTVVAVARTVLGGGPPTWDIVQVDPQANFSTGSRQGITVGNVSDFRFARLRVLDLSPDAGAPAIALLERRIGGFGGQLHRVALGSTGQAFTGSMSFAADDFAELPGTDSLVVGFRCHMTCSVGPIFGNVGTPSLWTTVIPFDPRLNTLGAPASLFATVTGFSGNAPHRLVGAPAAMVVAGQAQSAPSNAFVERRSLTGSSQWSAASTGPLRVVDAISGPDPDTVLILAASTGAGTFNGQTIPHLGTLGLTDVVLIVMSASTTAVRVQTWALPGNQVPVAMAWTSVAGIIESYRLIIVGNEGPQGTDGFLWAVPL
ncbi:MAG: hypothetical protein SFW67_24715 [Myxococcaceae bacterium]|nr:hypothetical protein [Myxococcaceae bacterium]